MGKRIKIPRTIEDKTARLVTLDGIATATGWERAAIVASIVGPGQGKGNHRIDKTDNRLSVDTFVKMKVVGLSHKDTVRKYRDAWFIGAGREMPESGKQVELPDLAWPPPLANEVAYPEPTKPATVAKSTPKAEPAARATRPAAAVSVAKAEEPQPVAQSHSPGEPGYDNYAERRQPDGSVRPDPNKARLERARQHMIEMFGFTSNLSQALRVLQAEKDDITDDEIEEAWAIINKITDVLKSRQGQSHSHMKVVK